MVDFCWKNSPANAQELDAKKEGAGSAAPSD